MIRTWAGEEILAYTANFNVTSDKAAEQVLTRYHGGFAEHCLGEPEFLLKNRAFTSNPTLKPDSMRYGMAIDKYDTADSGTQAENS